MSEHPFHCHVARFEPRFCDGRRHKRSSALVITLVVLALVSILVIAFLGLASQDLKSTNFYVRSEQADQIARGGLDLIVGNLREEILDPALSANGSSSSPFYAPTYGTNTFPMRMVPLGAASTNVLLTSASATFYTNTGVGALNPPTLESAIPSTNFSLNNQVITASDWNRPMLIPSGQVQNMTIPNWIFVSRSGPVSLAATTPSSAVRQNLSNANGVIGRYAFVVYDTSGLLDINVAGYDASQPSMATNAAGKGLLPYAELTNLPATSGNISTADVNTLVQFRNAVSETNYPMALTNAAVPNLLTNGFMQVYAPTPGGTTDSTFLSRQELIQYASNNPAWIGALPYLTTFSREINGPTYGPTANMGVLNGTNYNYQTTAATASTSATTINPNIYAVKVQQAFPRNNGIEAVVGEPLVKYRFPLDKLALLESVGPTYSYSDWQSNKDNIQTNIQKYFGLDLVNDSNGLYRHWQYPTTSSNYVHSNNTILTLAQVAALSTPREPDFFELLQAGILNGSLAGWGRGDATGASTTIEDWDPKTMPQIMRIGANIIDEWKADSYPTTISFGPIDVYGVADLPYLTQMFTKGYSPNSNGATIRKAPVYPYVYFQAWRPYQAPSTVNPANYPSSFRIVPFYYTGDPTKTATYSDNYLIGVEVSIAGSGQGGYKWFYDPTIGGYSIKNGPSAGGGLFATLGVSSTAARTFGGGLETDPLAGLQFTSANPLTDYREPGLVVGSPHPADNGGAGGVWNSGTVSGSPSGQLAAISLPEIKTLPTSANNSDSTPKQGGVSDPPIPWNSLTMGSVWNVEFQIQATFVLQFKDVGGTWHTYGTFEGVDSQLLTGATGWENSSFLIPINSSSTDDVAWAKTDPRTFRFGPGDVAQQTTPPKNSQNPPLQNPTTPYWVIWGITPFGASSSTAASPYRMDYWVANNKANPVQGASFNAATITDLDGIIRGGDSAYAYSGSAGWGCNPLLSGSTSSTYVSSALPARPVMLNHPFHSVGDLGYAYRDDPWRTLDFMTPGSAEAGLLDLFSLSEATIMAGRVNPNTPYPQVIQALVSGATQSSVNNVTGAVATVPASSAQNVAQNLASFTSSPSNAITNRAALVTSGAVANIINSGAFADSGTSKVKTEGESIVRSLAESSNTRTWNLLIDVIGQSGHFVNSSASVSSGGRDNFVVEGERHYWLHVAIDRYTGQVVDQQLELVDQ